MPTIDPWLNTQLVYDLYLKSIEGPWLVDRLWEAHVTFFLLHNKFLQVAIWLGMWTVFFLKVLTTWQTSLCWSVIYLCEVVAEGVWYFGSILCTRTWYQSFYEEPLSILIKIWNRCCWNFERVFGSGFSMNLWLVGGVPLCFEHCFHLEIVFISLKTIYVFSINTHFSRSEGIMLQWQVCFIFIF